MNPNENATPAEAPQVPEFTPGIANAPQAPAEPAQVPAEAQTQPAPAEQPASAPTTPGEAPTQTPAQAPAEQPASQPAAPAPQVDYDKYLDDLIAQANPASNTPVELKMPTEEDLKNDDKALENFFTGLVDSAVQRSVAENNKQAVIREAETNAWNDVFTKYPEIKESKSLRDTIHNIRMGAYQRGQAFSPVQVADQLIGDLHTQYKKGVNDTNVQTTVRQSQPLGGGTQEQPTPRVDYAKLQDGGESAAVSELEKLISQGLI